MQVVYKRKTLLQRIKKFGTAKFALFTVFFIAFAIYAATLIVPFVWMLYNSFKDSTIFNQDRWSIDFGAGFKNFQEAFKLRVSSGRSSNVTLPMMFLNSLLVVGTGVLATLISCSTGAYVVAKFNFPGKKIIYNVVIIAMIIPIVGTLPAQYRFLNNLKLIDNIFGMIFLYSGGFGFNFLFLNAYFKGISTGYMEAARIDGASEFRIFLRIMLPMATPALTAIGILTFIGLWGDYSTPSIFYKSSPTVAVGLAILDENMKFQANRPVQLAAVTMAVIPVIVLFGIFQQTIINNISVGGGLKG